MLKLKIAGVPEHFNFPWYYAIEKGLFKEKNIDLIWKDFGEGTGAMQEAINTEAIDLALVLTEGAIRDILKNPVKKIIQAYVNSPLLWGIHTSAKSSAKTMEELKNKKYAISRFGSGSHLMAFVDAENRGWKIKEEQFVIVKNLEGAKNALKNGKADIFFWEKYTTQPLIDAGFFKRIDICPTPWPCFVLEAHQNILEKYPEAIFNLQNIINQTTRVLKNDLSTPQKIAEKYQLKVSQVEEWFAQTEWTTNNEFQKKDLAITQNTLKKLNLIDNIEKNEFFCDIKFCKLF